jgi:hypothetical protein
MSEVKVGTTSVKMNRELEVTFDFGDTLDEAVAKFGADVVYSNFKKSAVIALQAVVRRELDKKEEAKSNEEITAKVATWKPGVARVSTVDAKETILKKVGKMSKAERDALIEQLLAAQ